MTERTAPYSLLTNVMRSLYGTRSLTHQVEARLLLNEFVDDPVSMELVGLHELARLRIWTALRHPKIPSATRSVRPLVRELLRKKYEDDPEALWGIEEIARQLAVDPLIAQYALIGLENDLEIEVYSIPQTVRDTVWNFAAVRLSPTMVELKTRRQANL